MKNRKMACQYMHCYCSNPYLTQRLLWTNSVIPHRFYSFFPLLLFFFYFFFFFFFFLRRGCFTFWFLSFSPWFLQNEYATSLHMHWTRMYADDFHLSLENLFTSTRGFRIFLDYWNMRGSKNHNVIVSHLFFFKFPTLHIWIIPPEFTKRGNFFFSFFLCFYLFIHFQFLIIRFDSVWSAGKLRFPELSASFIVCQEKQTKLKAAYFLLAMHDIIVTQNWKILTQN